MKHMTPCYKKFTVILSSQSNETVTPKRLSGSLRISLGSTSACVYLDDCNFFIKQNETQGEDCFTKKNYNF